MKPYSNATMTGELGGWRLSRDKKMIARGWCPPNEHAVGKDEGSTFHLIVSNTVRF